MGVRRQARLGGFPTEGVDALDVDAPLEEGAGVDARGGVTLEVDRVADAVEILALEEMVEADLVQVGARGVAREKREFARCTMATAFQRIMPPMRFSISRSPGYAGSSSTGMVLT